MFKFIDVCSGIGGFHQSMVNIGGECVYAVEIDKLTADTYTTNYGIDCLRDLTKVNEKDIPRFDVMCAGFPCVSFSKAGNQAGFEDERGQVFFHIVRILEEHKPKYIILENVKQLLTHDNGNTWDVVHSELKRIGYGLTLEPIVCSPHQLNIPQIRERVVILGEYGVSHLDISNDLEWNKDFNIYTSGILEENVDIKYKITEIEEQVFTIWQEFIEIVGRKGISTPIWVDFLSEGYDYSHHAKWLHSVAQRNEKLYLKHKDKLDVWLRKHNYLRDFNEGLRRLEWQAGEDILTLWDGFIQLRPSGIRVKRANYFPALVAMVQTPIIGKLKRRITPREAARLQSFPDSFKIPQNDKLAYKQFGNAVNVDVITYFAKKLIYKDKEL